MAMKFIKKFEELGINDISLVGGKNASLGEMIQNLSSKGVLIPSGFVITAQSYKYYLNFNNLDKKISLLLKNINKNNLKQFAVIGKKIRNLIYKANFPKDLEQEILQSYIEMQKKYGKLCSVAVRSSATAEDLPEASFAGQQDTFLNVSGEKELLNACKKSFASLFNDRAISYRIDHKFDHMSVYLSIGIQKMVRSDKASAGVAFTLDTESGFKDIIFINSSYGLGENVVQGSVSPDEFYVHKLTLEKGFAPILKKRLGSKDKKLIYSGVLNNPVKNILVNQEDKIKYSLNDQEILTIAKQCLIIEKHYSNFKNKWVPMDIEWAKDGLDGKIYIVQARPETVHSLKQDQNFTQEYILDKKSNNKVLVTGKSVGRKIATGTVRVISSAKNMHQVKQGDILVTDMTDPDWEPIMKRAAGIVTNRGGRTCHAAIVSREIGIPAIVGADGATKKLKTGDIVTIDCSSGEVGYVYAGKINFKIEKIELKKIPKLKTEIFTNIGDPDEAFNVAKLPVQGVGLARLEFIINNSIKIHPCALVEPEKVLLKKDKEIINKLTVGYKNKKQYFIDKLAQEAGTIAAAFYPRPVIIRLSDFKSNEYKQLIAGKYFEPEEENPMIGFRGASRYYNEKYKHAFELECLAIKKIREEMGLDNVIVMIPFVRTTKEAELVLQEMKKNKLERGKDGLQVYMMCEIPSNVILIDEFSKYFDGFSIGSNDLTQTTLAVDRDSELVANIFDERNDAVKIMMSMAIKGAKRNKKKIGICGQAPSDYPEITEFLVKEGIDSISLNPDTVLKEIVLLAKK
ncbi:MAG: Phosphoenolpyruvate synthase [candidate division TM6 bacterium GW2011_GWF2_28_16]|nr:MAG: Phosphoenolpyruvate synthase [candidate division TM6 bacterium GW2011_GWF2_28_16]